MHTYTLLLFYDCMYVFSVHLHAYIHTHTYIGSSLLVSTTTVKRVISKGASFATILANMSSDDDDDDVDVTHPCVSDETWRGMILIDMCVFYMVCCVCVLYMFFFVLCIYSVDDKTTTCTTCEKR